MTNKEKIEEFMSRIEQDWSDLKKLRYICIELCKIYKYNPKYRFGTEDGRMEIMNKIFEERFSRTEQELPEESYETTEKICVDLFEIYEMLVKRAGIDGSKYDCVGNAIFYRDESSKKSYYIHPVEELTRVKTKREPKSFKIDGTPDIKTIKKIDQELGYIDENGYLDDRDEMQLDTSTEKGLPLNQQIESVLEKGRKYLEKIGVQIDDSELYNYYVYVMRTAFPNLVSKIQAISSKDLEDIQYVLLARPKVTKQEWICLLYDKKDGKFNGRSIEEIQEMMKTSGMEEVGKKRGILTGTDR